MKTFFTVTGFLFISLLLIGNGALAQVPDTTKPFPPPPPMRPTATNGFDVIIKKNGEIIYGLVKEVGLDLIIYQRTDIPNGPIILFRAWRYMRSATETRLKTYWLRLRMVQ